MTVQATIIVIAFNEESRISDCLIALLAQDTDMPYEIIVVDDGSDDSTSSLVKGLQLQFDNLRLIQHTTNLGRGAARRTGQDATESPWIGFVDADILVPPTWLARCVEALTDADAVSGIAQPDGDCAVLWRICRATLRDRAGSAEITGNNVVFSRTTLAHVPFSPGARLGEDFRLAKLMTQAGFTLRTLTSLKVKHRESKTYAKAISWMFETGEDAALLPFEFRILRLADIAWLAWFFGLIFLAVLAGVGVLDVWISLALVVALTFVVNALFIFSRFKIQPYPSRFVASLVVNAPLMLAYLAGRSLGLFRVPFVLRRSNR